jgi:hypothetical protein
MRISSPRFVAEKARAVLRAGALRKYAGIVGRGLRGRRH